MKKFIAFVMMLCICASFAGCATEEEILNNDIMKLEAEVSSLKSEISDLKSEKNSLINEITNIKIENGIAKYIVTFNIKHSHFTLDISQHIKDEMNDISIQIPVDKEYYDSIEIGDTIADDFRMGSFVLCGSFGNWDVTVEDKSVQ